MACAARVGHDAGVKKPVQVKEYWFPVLLHDTRSLLLATPESFLMMMTWPVVRFVSVNW
jgi:hypothetical protein